MNIALMTNNYKPFVGGVPISVELLAQGLQAAGHRVTVFAPEYPEKYENTVPTHPENCPQPSPDIPAAGYSRIPASTPAPAVPVFRCAAFARRFPGGTVVPNPLDPRIEEAFARGGYDLIHVHHPVVLGNTAVSLSRKYGVPLVFTYHTRYEQYLCSFKSVRRLERNAGETGSFRLRMERTALSGIRDGIVPLYLHLFLQNCCQVFAPTGGIRNYLTETCGYDPDRVALLPTGIEDACFQADAEMVRQIRKRFRAEKIPLFLSVSRMAHEKNIPFLLRSAACFKELYARPFRLLLIGDGPDRTEYEALRSRLGLTQEVFFLGQLPHRDLTPYYAAADAFFFASRTETQGIVIPEAFAGGTPVVALAGSGVRDLVTDGVNGLLCAETESEEALARRLLFFTEHPRLQERLRAQARRTAEDFREEAVVRKAIRLYNKSIAQYRRERTRPGAGVWEFTL